MDLVQSFGVLFDTDSYDSVAHGFCRVDEEKSHLTVTPGINVILHSPGFTARKSYLLWKIYLVETLVILFRAYRLLLHDRQTCSI